MIPLIIALVLVSFIQSSLIPLELILLVFIARSFIMEDKANYYLAFFFGILLSTLLGFSIGYLSLVYLVVVKAVNLIRNLTFASNWLMIIPLSFIILILYGMLEKVLWGTNLNWWRIMLETFLSLPIYLSLRFWEERFTPRKDIKLKI